MTATTASCCSSSSRTASCCQAGPDRRACIRARERHAATMAELPAVVNRLQRGEAAIPTIYEEN